MRLIGRISAIVILVSVFASFLSSQQTGATTNTASPSPSPALSTTSNTPLPQATSFLAGTWKIERAIFEYFGNLKEVTGVDERFFQNIVFNNSGKGTAHYNTKTEGADLEWDLKDGQNLTVAFGSRLKPQLDLYKVLALGDGSIFLRSTKLANANGTIIYILRKVE